MWDHGVNILHYNKTYNKAYCIFFSYSGIGVFMKYK